MLLDELKLNEFSQIHIWEGKQKSTLLKMIVVATYFLDS